MLNTNYDSKFGKEGLTFDDVLLIIHPLFLYFEKRKGAVFILLFYTKNVNNIFIRCAVRKKARKKKINAK